jgi:hypothetical protein
MAGTRPAQSDGLLLGHRRRSPRMLVVSGHAVGNLDSMARTDHEDIAAAEAEWREAQARADDARARLINAVRSASESGTGERILAEQAHVTRQTIRQWIGRKPS